MCGDGRERSGANHGRVDELDRNVLGVIVAPWSRYNEAATTGEHPGQAERIGREVTDQGPLCSGWLADTWVVGAGGAGVWAVGIWVENASTSSS